MFYYSYKYCSIKNIKRILFNTDWLSPCKLACFYKSVAIWHEIIENQIKHQQYYAILQRLIQPHIADDLLQSDDQVEDVDAEEINARFVEYIIPEKMLMLLNYNKKSE